MDRFANLLRRAVDTVQELRHGAANAREAFPDAQDRDDARDSRVIEAAKGLPSDGSERPADRFLELTRDRLPERLLARAEGPLAAHDYAEARQGRALEARDERRPSNNAATPEPSGPPAGEPDWVARANEEEDRIQRSAAAHMRAMALDLTGDARNIEDVMDACRTDQMYEERAAHNERDR